MSRNRGSKRGSAPADPSSTQTNSAKQTALSHERDEDLPGAGGTGDVGSFDVIMGTPSQKQTPQHESNTDKETTGPHPSHDNENEHQNNTSHTPGSDSEKGDNEGSTKSPG